MKESIISAGIDIGTTTTQLILSRFTIDNLSNGYTVPRISITGKQILYESPVYFTPLIDQETVDTDAIKNIISSEYKKSGIERDQVKTGAVIITGETARKKNAAAVLQALSGYAGDFVVATAGPDLESVLSGTGAGTNIISKKTHSTVANIDIGGGTSNISVFRNGELIGTSCLDIGGRLIKVNRQNKRITYIYGRTADLARSNGISIQVDTTADESVLSSLCTCMGTVLSDALGLTNGISDLPFYTNNGKKLTMQNKIDGITFSGGVADIMYTHNAPETYEYGDIGVLLGRALLQNKALHSVTWHIPAETIRATVVGAGMHTTKITGSTISYDQNQLPLKNIPVLYLNDKELLSSAEILANRLPVYMHRDSGAVAISFSGTKHTDFEEIQNLASDIVSGTADYIKSNLPLIIVTEKDISKALSFALRRILPPMYPLICIDSICTGGGDYIDIGMPVASGQVLPVVIKTLVFNT